ncbi:hypothetical protein [Nocardia aurantia]|uniref:Uncharacterized protein n=1 Tax=Nocardia aurantia TaxID=2585199 RepID=A0A7K0DX81_9NOCA|nr:hypothetical protein [Nocardia aurantia]MQY30147.1 hypothetical protein [Nocardia aurantia]
MRPDGPAENTDAPYVPDREIFGGYSHREIWELVHERLDPGAIGQVAETWQRRGELIDEAFHAFAAATDAGLARWSGRTRQAALEATRQLLSHGLAAADACAALHRLLAADSEAAQTIRDAIAAPPPPYLPLADPAAEAVHGARRRAEYDLRAATTLADVRDVMTYRYNPTLPASGDSVPRFAPLPPDSGPGEGPQR